MKVIAIVVLTAFIPNQISWAFNYNPAILYKNLPEYALQNTGMMMPKPAMQVAGSMEYLLKQIQDKPKLHLELNLDSSAVIPRKPRLWPGPRPRRWRESIL